MMARAYRPIICSFFFLIGISSIWGCRITAKSPEQILRARLEKRFNEYIQYRKEKNYQKAYQMYSPAYRKRVSPFEFVKKTFPDESKVQVTIVSASIDKIELSHHNTEGMVFYSMKAKLFTLLMPTEKPLPLDTKTRERWVLINEQWYREPKHVLVNVSGARYYVDQY